ncbi:hypothetical protein [Methylobacterium sp. ID0610]|uniref:hypothetical protein n=1 Tax=Methylobacterium carpenticola TaxID=3344827 RepID=UPI0036A01070
MTMVLATQRGRHHSWLSYGIGVLLLLAPTGFRLAFGDHLQGVPFIMLTPAIALAALLGGVRAGLVTAGLASPRPRSGSCPSASRGRSAGRAAP